MKTLQTWVRRLRRRTVSEEGFTLSELMIVIAITAIIVAVIATAMTASVKTTTSAQSRTDRSNDAQLVSAYWVSDAANASTVSTSSVPVGGCELTGLASPSLVAGFTWSDAAPVVKSAVYVSSGGKLVRRYCERGGANDTHHDTTVVKELASAQATCPNDATCTGLPSRVQLAVSEPDSYNYSLQGMPRTQSPHDSPLMGNIAIYVGGTLSMNAQGTVNVLGASMVYVGGATDCNNQSTINSDYFYSGGSDDPQGHCPNNGDSSYPDPLESVVAPSAPTNLNPATDTSNPCSAPTVTTFRPGRYTGNVTMTGCLAPGLYWLDAGATLRDVTSAPGGVLFYVNNGNLDIDRSATLTPWVGGSYPGGSYANTEHLTLFSRKTPAPGLANTILIQTNSGTVVNIDGVIYAKNGSLELRNSNANLQLTGAINVKNLAINGQGASAQPVSVTY